MRIGINSLFSTEVVTKSISEKLDKLDMTAEYITRNQDFRTYKGVDCHAIPMHLMDQEQVKDEVIAALIPCGARTYSIVMHHDLQDAEHRLGFYPEMEIIHPPTFFAAALKSLHPAMSLVEEGNEATLTSIKNLEKISCIAETCFLPENVQNHYRVTELNSREFGHGAGQGMMALVMERSSPLMKIVRKWNSRDMISVSNVERKCVKEVGMQANVHCEIDSAGNFLLWLMTEIGSAHLSQSTKVGIERNIIEKLQSKE